MAAESILTGTFARRTELKYLLDTGTAMTLLKGGGLAPDLVPDFLANDTRFNVIENVYLDSPDLISYREHLEGKDQRFKIRIRHYHPNGLPESSVFIEIKSKAGRETHKTRIKVRPTWLNKLLTGNQSNLEKILDHNDDLPRAYVEEVLRCLNEAVLEHGFGPMLKTTYVRNAFRSNDWPDFRITFDRFIHFIRLGHSVEPRDPGLPDIAEDAIIMEVKMGERIPPGAMERLHGMADLSVRFSKYCAGIHSTADARLDFMHEFER